MLFTARRGRQCATKAGAAPRPTNTVLVLEMAIAIAVSAYSLYMTFNGLGGFPGKY
jgi:hypothetical protein